MAWQMRGCTTGIKRAGWRMHILPPRAGRAKQELLPRIWSPPLSSWSSIHFVVMTLCRIEILSLAVEWQGRGGALDVRFHGEVKHHEADSLSFLSFVHSTWHPGGMAFASQPHGGPEGGAVEPGELRARTNGSVHRRRGRLSHLPHPRINCGTQRRAPGICRGAQRQQ